MGGFRLVSGATPLAVNALGNTADLPSYADMFLGLRGGSLGETCILALLIGGIFLIVRGVIKPIIPVAFLGTICLLYTSRCYRCSQLCAELPGERY